MQAGECSNTEITDSKPPARLHTKGGFLLDKKLIESILSERHVLYRRDFARVFGGVCPGLFLSQLFYWMGRGQDEDGWIYKTMDEWNEETGMTRKELERARRMLRETLVLEEKRGVSKLYYRVNMDVLIEKLADASNRPIGAVRTAQSVQSETSDSGDTNITEITHKLPIEKKEKPPDGDLGESPPVYMSNPYKPPVPKYPELESLTHSELIEKGYFRIHDGVIKQRVSKEKIPKIFKPKT